MNQTSDCPNVTIVKTCTCCSLKKPLSDFPKKGAGRYENKCKPCHNKIISDRREKRKPTVQPTWSIKSIPCSIEYAYNEPSNFVDVLHSLIKSVGFVGNPEQVLTIDSIFKNKSTILTMLEEKGDSV